MWFRRFWTALWQRFKAGPPPDRPVQQPNRLLVYALLKQLNPQLFERYSGSQGQVRHLQVYYPTIDAYVRALGEASQLVMTDQPIPHDWLKPELHRVSLDRFLTSADGYYLNPRHAVERFQTVALQLCEALEASDEVTYGVPEHNLRMLTRVLVNLQSLTTALIEVSAEG
jgi:hypothetical protein